MQCPESGAKWVGIYIGDIYHLGTTGAWGRSGTGIGGV